MTDDRTDGTITISELSHATGLTVSALRYYDDQGLVPAVGRRGTTRTYHRHAVDRVAVVVAAQRCGFTLTEIGALINTHATDRDHWRAVLRDKSAELRDTARQHERMAAMLEHSLECRAADPLTCPTLLAGIRDLAGTPPPG